MNDVEAVEMMQRCSREIKSLRAEVERLRPKAEAYDNLASVIALAAPRNATVGRDDVARMLDDRIEKIRETAKAVSAA